MEARPRVVRTYVTPEGNEPFQIWLEGLRDLRGRAKIDARIARLRTGNLGKCDPVGEGVLELKIDFGPGYRVYCGEDGREIVILLCGGDKRTQKADIAKAKEYWREYRS